MRSKREVLDIGFSDYGRGLDYKGEPSKASYVPKDTTIGLDPELIDEELSFKQVKGVAEDLPFESDSLDRITSSYVIGAHANIEDSIEEIVRTLKP